MTEELDWITSADCFALYHKGAAWLRDKGVPSKVHEMTGQRLYEHTVVKQKLAEPDDEPLGKLNTSVNGKSQAKEEAETEVVYEVSSNIKETANLLRQAHLHLEKMFALHDKSQHSLFTTLVTYAEKQNAHIIDLEQNSLEMKIVTEKAMSLQHERDLLTQQDQRRGAMQEKALATMAETLGPWIQQKLGAGTDGATKAPTTPVEKVGAFTVQILSALSDEKFAELEGVLGEETFGALKALRAAIKEGAS